MAKAIMPPQRKITKKGNLMMISVWQVQVSKDYPEGINYSFQLISEGRRVLGYDNNTSEGHHKHYLKEDKLVKKEIEFKNWIELFEQFEKEVEEFENE